MGVRRWQNHAEGREGPEPTARWAAAEDLRGVVSIGTFRERTRAAKARAEALAYMKLLGTENKAVDVLGNAPVVKVIKLRLRFADAVFAAIPRLRSDPHVSDLTVAQVWMQPSKNPAEIARVALVGRAIKSLNTRLEEAKHKWRRLLWNVEGSYAPSAEAACITLGFFVTEAKLIHEDRVACGRRRLSSSFKTRRRNLG